MDPLLSGLVNLGGGFVLAAVILLLHREALKSFREELCKEREVFRQAIQSVETERDVSDRRHQENLARLDLILEHVRPPRVN